MLFYSWNKIYKATDGRLVDIVRIFRMLASEAIPDNKFDPIYQYSGMDFSGLSYIGNPKGLLNNLHRHSYKDVGVYLSLASLRNPAHYAATGDASLPVIVVPMDRETLFDYVENNELLHLSDDKENIFFIYEEMTDTRTLH